MTGEVELVESMLAHKECEDVFQFDLIRMAGRLPFQQSLEHNEYVAQIVAGVVICNEQQSSLVSAIVLTIRMQEYPNL